MGGSFTGFQRSTVAALLGGAILLTSACSTLSSGGELSTPEVTASSPSPAASPSSSPASPSISSALDAERKANKKMRDESKSLLKINGIDVTDKLVKTANGEYPQIAVNKNGKYAKFNSSKHSGGLPAGWTKKVAGEAQAFGMNFLLQEVIDSPVGGTAGQVDAEYSKWKKRNGSKFHPEVKDGYIEADAEANVDIRDWQNYGEFATADYMYPHDGVTPRVKSVNMTLNKSQEFRGGIYFEYTGSISMNGQSTKNRNIVETSAIDLSYTVLKIDGKFVIAGDAYKYSFDSDIVTAQLNPKN